MKSKLEKYKLQIITQYKMHRNEIWAEYKVGAGNYQSFMFKVDNSMKNFQITINSQVNEKGMDVIYILCPYDDYKKLQAWWVNSWTYKKDSSGQMVKDTQGNPVVVSIPAPLTNKIINRQTNFLEKTISLDAGVYALIFDNRYSAINSKSIWLEIREEWGKDTPPANLPIIDQMLNDVPMDVASCIKDANDCYVSGHFNQCSVMLRKVVELAIKIKLQQSEINIDEMTDKNGNDLPLSAKIKLLRKHRLITPRSVSDVNTIKWFGDTGVHGTMRVSHQDIKDNVEPKIRNFLVGLNLES